MLARYIGAPLMSIVEALNAIHDNVWALAIIAIGGMTYKRDSVLGTSLITLGAGLFRGTAQNRVAVAPDSASANANANANSTSIHKE